MFIIFSRVANNMARVPCFLIASVIIYLSLPLSTALVNDLDKLAPEFDTLRPINLTKNENFTKVVFEVRGKNIIPNIRIKTTIEKAEKNSLCQEDLKYPIREIFVGDTSGSYEISVPRNVAGNFYLCLPHENPDYKEDEVKFPPSVFSSVPRKWVHQGPDVAVTVVPDEKTR